MDNITTPPVRILMAGCNLSVMGSTVQLLGQEQYEVKLAISQSSATDLLAQHRFDLAILDVSLTDGSGYSLCLYIKSKYDIPVIFMAEAVDEYSVVTALDIGADDYISVPYRSRELLSRIKSVLRRTGKTQAILEHGNLRVDTVKGLVTKNGREIFLSALEYRMLLTFLSNKGRVLSRSKLLEEIWAVDGDYVNDNTLTVYIKRIREKIEDNPAAPQMIKTVRGKGYKVGE